MVFVFCNIFALSLLLNGWLNSEEIVQVTEPDYSIQVGNASYARVEEFCQVVMSLSETHIDRILLITELPSPDIEETLGNHFRIASMFPSFNDPAIEAYFKETADSNNRFALNSSDFQFLCITILSQNRNVDSTNNKSVSIPDSWHTDIDKMSLSWEASNGVTYYFQKLPYSEELHGDYCYLFVPLSQIELEDITEIELYPDGILTDEAIDTINQVSYHFFGKTIDLHTTWEESPLNDTKAFICLATVCATLTILPLVIYAHAVRRKELAILRLCGETSGGIFLHCTLLFSILLLTSEMLGLLFFKFLCVILRDYYLSPSLETGDLILHTALFHILISIVFMLHLFLASLVHQKEFAL